MWSKLRVEEAASSPVAFENPVFAIFTRNMPNSADKFQAFSKECEQIFSYFTTKTYIVGTQKNRLIEKVRLSTQNMSKTYG